MRVRGNLGQSMLAPAEADLEPKLGRTSSKGGSGIVGVIEAQPGQGFGQEQFLPRPQRLPPLPAVEPVGRGLEGRQAQRLKADFRAETRSVFSQVKVPSSRSGSRPKWP
jgi:hypothetical protein